MKGGYMCKATLSSRFRLLSLVLLLLPTVGHPQSSIQELCKSTFEGAEYTTVSRTPIKANHVAGNVVARSFDSPIEGATVMLTDKRFEKVLAVEITDAGGNFRFATTSPGLHYLMVCKPGFSPTQFSIRLTRFPKITKSVRIEISAH